MLKIKAISFITAAVLVCLSFFFFLPDVYAEGEPEEDITPPEVTSTSPSGGETGVSESTDITVTFSEDIQAGEAVVYDTITLKKDDTAITINKSIIGSTLTLTPESTLYEGTYAVTISAGSVTDLTGNALVSDYTFSFTAEGAPRVLYTDPADGATSVPGNKVFSVYFDQPITYDPAKITVTLHGGIYTHATNVTVTNNSVLTITPRYGWETSASTFIISIKAGAVSDDDGHTNAEDLTFQFTTLDSHGPYPSQYTPANNAHNVALEEPIIITYNKNIYPDINFGNATAKVRGTDENILVTVSIVDSNKVKIVPTSGKWPNKRFIDWYLPPYFVKNSDNYSSNLSHSSYFVTVDLIGPVLSYSFPVDSAIGFSVTEEAIFSFDEPVYPGPEYSGITAACEGEPVPLTKTINSYQLLLINRTRWKWEKTYTIHIPAGALQDIAGNTNAVGYDLTFTTAKKPALTIENPRGTVMVYYTPYRFFYNVDVACNIKLQILNYNQSILLRTYNVNNVSPGMHSIYWDAKNSSGSYYNDTGVHVKITASPLDGSPQLVATAVYDRIPKADIAVTKFPSTWYPKKTTFYTEFTLNTTGTMSISFYKGTTLVLQVTGGSDTPYTTLYGWAWDGKLSDGTYIPAGYYTVVYRFANEGSKDSIRKYVTIKY